MRVLSFSHMPEQWIPQRFKDSAGALLLLPVYVAMNVMVERLTHLPVAAYHEQSALLALLHHTGWVITTLVVIAAATLTWFGHLLATWEDLEFGKGLRAFVFILSVTIAWPLVTSGYNYYFAQAYALEKLLLVALLPLVWWRPIFIYPLIALSYVLLWQLAEPPLGGTVLAHKLQVVRGLTVFAAAFLVYAASGNRKLPGFLLLLCCFVASAYWLPAVAKLKLSWFSSDFLHLVPLSAYAHGWLSFMQPERIVDLAEAMRPFNGLMKLFVIVAEGSCLFFLWRRRVSIVLLFAVIIFHLGVFALYGFLFWTWIALDAALLMLLLRMPGDIEKRLYQWPGLAISVVLILLAAYWAKPPALGWYDTPLTYTYRVEAIDENGNRSQLHPSFFAPYSDIFTMTAFSYTIAERATLVEPYGVTSDRDIMQALLGAGSAEDVFALEADSTRIRHNESRNRTLQQFLRQFVSHRARDSDRRDWLKILRAPPQFWSFRGEVPDARTIREFALVEISTFYNGTGLSDIRRHEIFRIVLPPLT